MPYDDALMLLHYRNNNAINYLVINPTMKTRSLKSIAIMALYKLINPICWLLISLKNDMGNLKLKTS